MHFKSIASIIGLLRRNSLRYLGSVQAFPPLAVNPKNRSSSHEPRLDVLTQASMLCLDSRHVLSELGSLAQIRVLQASHPDKSLGRVLPVLCLGRRSWSWVLTAICLGATDSSISLTAYATTISCCARRRHLSCCNATLTSAGVNL